MVNQPFLWPCLPEGNHTQVAFGIIALWSVDTTGMTCGHQHEPHRDQSGLDQLYHLAQIMQGGAPPVISWFIYSPIHYRQNPRINPSSWSYVHLSVLERGAPPCMDCSILAMTMVASLLKETVVFPTSLLASQVIGVTTQQNPVVFWGFSWYIQ
jgi:hypothetical protein